MLDRVVVPNRVGLALGLVLGLGSVEAQAFPSARLVYVRGQGAESCPGEIELRLSVAHRLGYDPFNTGSRRTIVAVIERSGERLTARMELVSEQGVSQGERRLEAAPDRCDDLIRALALSMSIAIDPERTDASPAAPPMVAAAPLAPPTDPTGGASAAADRDSSPPLYLRFGLGAQAGLGVAPAPALGLLVVGSGRHRNASLAFEYRLDAPASRAVAGGVNVESRLVTGAIVPCVHVDPGFACATGMLGTVAATSDGSGARDDSTTYAAAGLRLGTEWRLGGPLLLRTHADLLANLKRFELELDGTRVWEMPGFSGSLGLALFGSFP
jgi:hypothetical protein